MAAALLVAEEARRRRVGLREDRLVREGVVVAHDVVEVGMGLAADVGERNGEFRGGCRLS